MGVQKLYQRLARSAFVLSLLLLFVSVWSVWTYTADHAARRVSQSALVRAVSYYNSNRGAAVLTGVQSVVAHSKCPVGWKAATLDETWGGSVAGCLTAGKTTVGACPKVAAGVAHGVTQAVTAAKALKLWRGVELCVKVADKVATANWVYQAVGSKVCTKEAAKGFGVSCSSCVCGKAGSCPVTGGSWNLGNAQTPANAWVSASVVDTQAAVFVQAEQLGVSCVEGLAPAGKKWVWGLDSEARGCGTWGVDSVATVVADTTTLNAFLTSNGVHVSASLAAASSVVGVDANLVVRRQVQTKCSAACRNFVFDTSVVAGNVAVWQSLKVLTWVVGWGALTCWLMLLYVVLVKKGTASQQDYTRVVGWTLLVGLVVVVLLWVLVTDVSANVTGPNANAVSAEASGCVVDKNWSPVLAAWNASVNMDSLHSWLGWLTGFMVFQWLMTLLTSFWVCGQLGKECGSGEYQDVAVDSVEDDDEDFDGEDEYDL